MAELKLPAFLQKLFEDPAPQPHAPENKVKIPVLRIILDPYALFIDHFGRFVCLGLLFAAAMSMVSLLLGQGYMCAYSSYRLNGGYCHPTALWVLVSHLLNFFILSMFMGRWYQSALQNIACTASCCCRAMLPRRSDFRFFGLLLVFVLLSMISVLSLYMLYIRVPNPDWRIEIIYFAVVSLGFFVPFILMRFYSLFAFSVAGEARPPLSAIWDRSRGSTLRIMFSLTLLFFISVFLLFGFLNNFRLVDNKNVFYVNFFVEYLYNLMLLMIAAFFINHCYLQKFFLFGRNNDGQ